MILWLRFYVNLFRLDPRFSQKRLKQTKNFKKWPVLKICKYMIWYILAAFLGEKNKLI